MKGMRYDEIQARLDVGGSYQIEFMKLLCEINDTLLYIKDKDKPQVEFKIEEPAVPKKRGRPLKKGWSYATKEG
mgnify:FL=1